MDTYIWVVYGKVHDLGWTPKGDVYDEIGLYVWNIKESFIVNPIRRVYAIIILRGESSLDLLWLLQPDSSLKTWRYDDLRDL